MRRWDEGAARPKPVQLPMQAYGGDITWVPRGQEKPRVWAWAPYTDGESHRCRGIAIGWNDRIVQVGLEDGRHVVVWRAAVTYRV